LNGTRNYATHPHLHPHPHPHPHPSETNESIYARYGKSESESFPLKNKEHFSMSMGTNEEPAAGGLKGKKGDTFKLQT